MLKQKQFDYWEECIRIGLEEAGLVATDEQIKILTDSVKGGHENYSMAHGYDVIGSYTESQSQRELRELKDRLEKERIWKLSTEPCQRCTTKGSLKDMWGRNITCYACDGKGRA